MKSNTSSYDVDDVVYMVDISSKVGQSKKLREQMDSPFCHCFQDKYVLYRIQGRKENKVVHHDILKLCQDRDLPLWLKRLRYSVLQPEDN